jgi:glucose/arabinose dehydrogenase
MAALSMLFALSIPPDVRAAALSDLPAAPQLDMNLIASGLDRPTDIVSAGDGSGRLFIVEQAGRIRIVVNGSLLPTPFLDITDRVFSCSGGCENGMFAVAFPPDFRQSGLFYVTYSARGTGAWEHLARFHVNPATPNSADAASEETVLVITNPAGIYANHYGGSLAFSPKDGYLYLPVGDNDGENDPNQTAQNLTLLVGKVLRLDVSCCRGQSPPYGIPASNPFVGRSDVRPEIWASGLRNPWRMSFDRATGDLYIADVGQSTWEEIDVQPASSNGGENYGWSIAEGPSCFRPGCNLAGTVLPTLSYTHNPECAVIGGAVYRGANPALLPGAYYYGDLCSGKVWVARQQSDCTWTSELVLASGKAITTFGQDEAGELYLADYGTGDIFQLVLSSNMNQARSPAATPASHHVFIPAVRGPLPAIQQSALCPEQIAT